ncbi:22638_t:CDS:2, partial [Racocetra persica]
LPIRFGQNSYLKHRDIIYKRIRPVIEQRLKSKKELGDAWVAPVDMLQALLNDPEIAPDLDPNSVDYNYILDTIGETIFVSVGTTSKLAAYALYDLAGRKEYWQELYQEAQEINKQCNGKLKSEDIAKMVKLDSFVKESLRLSNCILFMPHKCISKSHYTFENGYQIPNGRIAMINFMDITNDEKLQ